MPDSPISYVIPLGLRCTTAEVFKRINHRNFALPFDWIYSSPSLIIDCLQTSFTHLLDSSQLYKVGMKGTLPLIGHTRYAKHLESVSRSVFNHHDVMNEEGHEYLQVSEARRAVRLRRRTRKHAKTREEQTIRGNKLSAPPSLTFTLTFTC